MQLHALRFSSVYKLEHQGFQRKNIMKLVSLGPGASTMRPDRDAFSRQNIGGQPHNGYLSEAYQAAALAFPHNDWALFYHQNNPFVAVNDDTPDATSYTTRHAALLADSEKNIAEEYNALDAEFAGKATHTVHVTAPVIEYKLNRRAGQQLVKAEAANIG